MLTVGMWASPRGTRSHGPSCEGMEFASEIVVKAARADLRVAEVPIVYHPRIRVETKYLKRRLEASPILAVAFANLPISRAWYRHVLTVGLVGQGSTVGISSGRTNLAVLSALFAVTGVVTIIFGVFTQTFLQNLGFQRPSRLSNWAKPEILTRKEPGRRHGCHRHRPGNRHD